MRFILTAIVLSPGLSYAQTLIEADRIVGVFRATEYAANDLNHDNFTDLSVLAISESGNALDLYTAISDPQTGQLGISEVAYEILPYHSSWRGDLRYSIGPNNDDYLPQVFIESKSLPSVFYFKTILSDDHLVIANAEIFQSHPNDGRRRYSCELVHLTPFMPSEPAIGRILSSDGTEVTFDPGKPPKLTEWSYADFLEECRREAPVFPYAPSTSLPQTSGKAPHINITRLVAEASQADGNSDGHNDRLLMVASEKDDAVDLITFMSTPETGALNYTTTIPAVLPATFPIHVEGDNGMQAINFYTDENTNVTTTEIWASHENTSLSAQLTWQLTGWEITQFSFSDYKKRIECRFDYQAGTLKIDPPDRDEFTVDSGPQPSLGPYWWQDVVQNHCLN